MTAPAAFCIFCGAVLPAEGQRFCATCGKSQVIETPPEPTSPAAPAAPAPALYAAPAVVDAVPQWGAPPPPPAGAADAGQWAQPVAPFAAPLSAPARKSRIPIPMILGGAVLIAAIGGAAVLGGFVPGLNSGSSAGPSGIAGGSPSVSAGPSGIAEGSPTATQAATATASASPSATPKATAKPTPKMSPLSPPGQFGLTGSLLTAREYHTATLLKDGRILIVGGDNDTTAYASAEVYNPATGKFSEVGKMSAPRTGHMAALLPNGRVLVFGGWVDAARKQALSSAEVWDPATGKFSPVGSMLLPRAEANAKVLKDGRVLITGGLRSGDIVVSTAEIYKASSGKFTATGSMTTTRTSHSATVLLDGRVLIAGGWDNNDDNLSSAEVYDPASGKFTKVKAMTATRWDHTATLLPDGRVLIAGGGTDSSSAHLRLASTEMFDPASNQFQPGPTMGQGRSCATASLLSGSRVLLAGGVNKDQELASAEILDLKTGKFAATGSLLKATACHTATSMPDGRVLLTGGWTGHALDTVEIYQP
ncbi:MAG TPA: kelch repeat-containing protein [Candidatus Limnocylindrales bacterium]